jgi:hypothetical protein
VTALHTVSNLRCGLGDERFDSHYIDSEAAAGHRPQREIGIRIHSVNTSSCRLWASVDLKFPINRLPPRALPSLCAAKDETSVEFMRPLLNSWAECSVVISC